MNGTDLDRFKVYKRVDNYNLPVIENLKRLIWVYFILLVFEGALRKWFLPGLSTPLLIVRDSYSFVDNISGMET